MASSFLDTLKVILSDTWEMSDSDYTKLSDIFISSGVSEFVLNSDVLQLFKVVVKSGDKFPICLDYLKSLWDSYHLPATITDTIIYLVTNNQAQVMKVTSKNTLSKYELEGQYDEGSPVVPVVVLSPSMQEVFNQFYYVVSQSAIIGESVVGMSIPKKISEIPLRIEKYFEGTSVQAQIESYFVDDVLGTADVSLLIYHIDTDDVPQSDCVRILNKHLSKCSGFKQADYLLEENDVCILLKVVVSEVSTKDMADSLAEAIMELQDFDDRIESERRGRI